MTEKQCPYGADECPKVRELEESIRTISMKLDTLIAIFVILHATEIGALIL